MTDIWSWFPIGPAGVRTFFLFLCGLTILTLRVAQYHVGVPTSNSAFEVFLRSIFRIQTLETLVCYTLSSLLFCPVFLLSAPQTANLHLVTYHSGDRTRLNEKPIFLACYLLTSAVWATCVHMFLDQDRLVLGRSEQEDRSKGSEDSRSSVTIVWSELPQIFAVAMARGIIVAVANIPTYHLFQRSSAWGWSMFFLRPIYGLPRTNMLPVAWPEDFWLLCRCAYAGFLVSLIWILGNIAFSVFMVKEPLKNGKPLTAESKDPNGSLLNGLKSRRAPVQVRQLGCPVRCGC